MEALTLIGISFVGTVLWVVSPEVASALYPTKYGWHPVAVGLTCAVGQVAAHWLLYVGGDRLIGRWGWLRRKTEAIHTRFGPKTESRYLGLTGVAMVFGMPPAVAMTAMASGFGVRPAHAMAVALVGRFTRFTILAIWGTAILAWWGTTFP
jgi:membrane protein YqaA with SNARE-associated domain